MKSYKSLVLLILSICLACPALLYAVENPVSIKKLKVEYAEMPLGIDVDNLRSDETANECSYCNTGYSSNSRQCQVMLEHSYP